MKIAATAIAGLTVVESPVRADPRGEFQRIFCEDELRELMGSRRIVQANRSLTLRQGAVRGLHFQNPPHAEMKLVRCTAGRIWDVAVDLRRDSSTFLAWHAEELSPGNGRMLVVPEGFAHGFQVLEPASEVLYLHTAAYAPQSESGVRYDDPRLAIRWPLAVSEVSDRDAALPRVDERFKGIAA